MDRWRQLQSFVFLYRMKDVGDYSTCWLNFYHLTFLFIFCFQVSMGLYVIIAKINLLCVVHDVKLLHKFNDHLIVIQFHIRFVADFLIPRLNYVISAEYLLQLTFVLSK